MNLKAKRMLSKILCIVMVLGMMPTLSLPAAAGSVPEESGYTYAVGLSASDAFTDTTYSVARDATTATFYARLTYVVDEATKVVTDGAYTLEASVDSTVVTEATVSDAATNGVYTITLSVTPPDKETDVTLTVTGKDGSETVAFNTFTITVPAKTQEPPTTENVTYAIALSTDGQTYTVGTNPAFTIAAENTSVDVYAKAVYYIDSDDDTLHDVDEGTYTIALSSVPTGVDAGDYAGGKFTLTVEEYRDAIAATPITASADGLDSTTFTLTVVENTQEPPTTENVTYAIALSTDGQTYTVGTNPAFTIAADKTSVNVYAKAMYYIDGDTSKLHDVAEAYTIDLSSVPTGVDAGDYAGGKFTLTVEQYRAAIEATTITASADGLDNSATFTLTVEENEQPDVDQTYIITFSATNATYSVEDGDDVEDNENGTYTISSDSITFTVKADEGYTVESVTYKIGASGEELTAELVGGSYTITGITADTTVTIKAVDEFEVLNLAVEEDSYPAATYTKSGNTINVKHEHKACVVLWTADKLTKEQATSADSSVEWHRAEAGAEAAEGHNFVVDEGAGTVVIAFIGDVDLDGKLIADDITKLITAVSAHSFGKTGEFANLLRDLVGDVDGDSKLIADDITKEITAVSTHGFQW